MASGKEFQAGLPPLLPQDGCGDEKEFAAELPPLSPLDGYGDKKEIEEHANKSMSTRSVDEKKRFPQTRDNAFARQCWTFVTWTPKRCRWDPNDPPKFSMALNLLFAFVSISQSIECIQLFSIIVWLQTSYVTS